MNITEPIELWGCQLMSSFRIAAMPTLKPEAPYKPKCSLCGDDGYFRTVDPPVEVAACAADIRRGLDREEIGLCTCDQGQFWVSWFVDLAEPMKNRYGVPMPAYPMPAQIPDGMITDYARSKAWLDAWVERRCA